MLTPDSSRFWPAQGYEPGHGQPSFDKQFARDWLKANEGKHDWELPADVAQKTIEKYLEAYEMITGKKLEASFSFIITDFYPKIKRYLRSFHCICGIFLYALNHK